MKPLKSVCIGLLFVVGLVTIRWIAGQNMQATVSQQMQWKLAADTLADTHDATINSAFAGCEDWTRSHSRHPISDFDGEENDTPQGWPAKRFRVLMTYHGPTSPGHWDIWRSVCEYNDGLFVSGNVDESNADQ